MRSECDQETPHRSLAGRRHPDQAQRNHRRGADNSLRRHNLGNGPSPSRGPTTMRSTIRPGTTQYSHRRRTSEPTPDSMSDRSARPIRRPVNSTRIRSGRATIPTVRRPASSIQRWSNTTDRTYRAANRRLPSAATPRSKSCPGKPRCRRRPTAMPHGRTGDRHTRRSDRRRYLFWPGPSGQNHPCRSGGSPRVRPGPHRFRLQTSLEE